MKALVCDRYGSLDDIAYRDVPEPVPADGEILVQVRAAGCMFTDVLFAEGRYQVKPALPFVLGSEVSGDVVGVGARVTRFKIGDRVMSLAPNFGGFAERVVIPEWTPCLLPLSVDYQSGSAVMSANATAQHALRQRANLQPAETLVVSGAAGGTGAAAVQIGKLLHARVIAVCSTPQRAEFCRALWADECIVYGEGVDLAARLKDSTAGRGVDVVFDTVGGPVFDACARAMAIEGRLLVVGFASGILPTLAVNMTLVKVYSVIGVHWLTFVQQHPEQHAANMGELANWLDSGKLTTTVTAVLPLSKGADALRRIARREAMGKIVLVP